MKNKKIVDSPLTNVAINDSIYPDCALKSPDELLNNERIKRAYRLVNLGWWELDIVNWKLSWSDELYEIYGLTKEDCPDPSLELLFNITHPEDVAFVKDQIYCLKGQQYFNWENRIVKPDGKIIYVLNEVELIRDNDGKPILLGAAAKDVTRRKNIQISLQSSQIEIKQSEERYKFLFYQSPTPKWIFDAVNHKFKDVNDAAIELYGYSREEFLSMYIFDLRAEEDVQNLRNIINNYDQNNILPYFAIVRHKKKNGHTIIAELNSILIKLKEGNHFIVEINDITDKIELENTIVRDKIERQKEISKAIIITQERERSEIGKELHDNVNQILTTAKLCIENSKYHPDQSFQFIDKSIGLLQTAINEIRILSKMLVTPTFYDMGFKEAIYELLEYYKLLNKFSVNEEFSINEQEIENELKLTIYRIIQEQLNNIVKYANAAVVSIILKRDQGALVLVISDNGIGFNLSNTKKGLGLNNIINRSGVYKGKVTITTSPGKGCIIEIKFPD